MTELLKNAWLGWQAFMTDGKLAALFMASLIFLWLTYKRTAQKTLLIYTTILAACCVFPVTAAGLMLYQTKFYDYPWIWSLVPMTAVTAYGAVLFLMECWPDWKRSEWKKGLPVLALLLAVLVLSGGLQTDVSGGKDAENRRNAEYVLTQVQEEMGKGEICLWAPQEIMEYARETDAAIQLLYGRNMWDGWLDAYVYDEYTEEIRALYEWMEEAAASGEASNIRGHVKAAFEAGADCILLPGELDEESVMRLETTLQIRISRQECPDSDAAGYYLVERKAQ